MIKSLISHHCSSKASKNRQEQDLFTRLASQLKEKLDAGMTFVAEPLESVLLSIADINRTAAVGAHVRARAKWTEEGESEDELLAAVHGMEKRQSSRARWSPARILPFSLAPPCSIFIGENVALMRDLDYCEVTNFPAATLSLDQEKAFDRMDWSFLLNTLSKMGFGDYFIKWIRLLYTNPRCSVMVNGPISPFSSPSRGVRQGCPLSPFFTYSAWRCQLVTSARRLSFRA